MRATAWLATPLAAANLLQMLTYAIDVIFIARLGEEPLAASALAVSLFGLVLWAMTALTGAVAPLIAEAIGAVIRSVRAASTIAALVKKPTSLPPVSTTGNSLCVVRSKAVAAVLSCASGANVS